MGSPPLTQGIYHLIARNFSDFGLTPAYAGNIGRVPQGHTDYKAHPRLCGEYHFDGNLFDPIVGSPRLCGEYESICMCLP